MTRSATARPVLEKPSRTNFGLVFRCAALAVVVTGATWATSRLLAVPVQVDRITFVNPTNYHVGIDVTGGARSGLVGVGTAQRSTTTTVEEVLDQGDTWVFRFTAQGEEGGELVVERAELERQGWTLQIPERVGVELRSRGAPLPP